VLHTTLSSIIAAVPNPGQGAPPPGSDGLIKILSWAAWIAVAVCVIGVLVTGSKMAIQHGRGQQGESVASLGWVLGGCIIIGSASALVGALV